MEKAVARSQGIQWTNKSVLKLAKGDDPIAVIEKRARDLVLRARDAGWSGPPFNPVAVADLLKIPVEANASVPDARIISREKRLIIQFNPTQARARVRFSIAHEIAHALFDDVADEIRNRGGSRSSSDDWQLEVLCNLAAAEFVMPAGSMPSSEELPPIEELMVRRKEFDVSAEAFLIRATKMTNEPIVMFCASAVQADAEPVRYRIDYTVPSKSAPSISFAGRLVPPNSIVHACSAISHSDKRVEKWFSMDAMGVECVGTPAYLGTSVPRVAGILRFGKAKRHDALKFIHGDVLAPCGSDAKIVCQLVNDQARFWGGGVAKNASRKYPEAQRAFAQWFANVPRSKRLGSVHFAQADKSIVIASLVGQKGFGPSSTPRIRYAALERCFEQVSEYAMSKSATVHMPRIGSGQSGGQWDTVEEIVRNTLVSNNVEVTVYDLPPKSVRSSPLELFS
jgi:O-acetyl-ADP-ribose deacetylase (regulator of RNase III)